MTYAIAPLAHLLDIEIAGQTLGRLLLVALIAFTLTSLSVEAIRRRRTPETPEDIDHQVEKNW